MFEIGCFRFCPEAVARSDQRRPVLSFESSPDNSRRVTGIGFGTRRGREAVLLGALGAALGDRSAVRYTGPRLAFIRVLMKAPPVVT